MTRAGARAWRGILSDDRAATPPGARASEDDPVHFDAEPIERLNSRIEATASPPGSGRGESGMARSSPAPAFHGDLDSLADHHRSDR